MGQWFHSKQTLESHMKKFNFLSQTTCVDDLLRTCAAILHLLPADQQQELASRLEVFETHAVPDAWAFHHLDKRLTTTEMRWVLCELVDGFETSEASQMTVKMSTEYVFSNRGECVKVRYGVPTSEGAQCSTALMFIARPLIMDRIDSLPKDGVHPTSEMVLRDLVWNEAKDKANGFLEVDWEHVYNQAGEILPGVKPFISRTTADAQEPNQPDPADTQLDLRWNLLLQCGFTSQDDFPNGNIRLFNPDGLDCGRWESKSKCVESAWNEALLKARGIRRLGLNETTSMSLEQQTLFLQEVLIGKSIRDLIRSDMPHFLDMELENEILDMPVVSGCGSDCAEALVLGHQLAIKCQDVKDKIAAAVAEQLRVFYFG